MRVRRGRQLAWRDAHPVHADALRAGRVPEPLPRGVHLALRPVLALDLVPVGDPHARNLDHVARPTVQDRCRVRRRLPPVPARARLHAAARLQHRVRLRPRDGLRRGRLAGLRDLAESVPPRPRRSRRVPAAAPVRAARGRDRRPALAQARRTWRRSLVDAAITAGLLVVSLSGAGSLWPFLALSFASGCSAALGNPAIRSMWPTLVPLELLTRALALRSTVFQATVVTGPAVGGLLFAISRSSSTERPSA